MSFQNTFKRAAGYALSALFVFGGTAVAQQSEFGSRVKDVAGPNNLYCAGYVQKAPVSTDLKIVGAVEEQEQFSYSANNFVYVSGGAKAGARVGDVLSVFRPRGEVKTKWTRKGDLGFYVQEVGALEVVVVKDDVSVARVKTSCDSVLLGDLVQPMEPRTSPVFTPRPKMELFGEPTGKAVGRLFMARDNQEMVGRDMIVYIDLGEEDNVKVGDYLTVFRPLGKGNLFVSDRKESVDGSVSDFDSPEYAGGGFSMMGTRKSGEKAGGGLVTTPKAKKDRPKGLRKVVGEMVILNVKERTATAVITRTAQEIHTGDWVEVQ